MKRTLVIVSILTAALSHPAYCGKTPRSSNEYVTYSATVKQKSMKPGSTGVLLFTLRPNNGIHINLTPPITVTFDSSGVAAANGALTVPKANEYLDASKPITQSFTLSRDVKPGSLPIRGTLTYFYCSDAEGWCSKFKQSVECTVKVAR